MKLHGVGEQSCQTTEGFKPPTKSISIERYKKILLQIKEWRRKLLQNYHSFAIKSYHKSYYILSNGITNSEKTRQFMLSRHVLNSELLSTSMQQMVQRILPKPTFSLSLFEEEISLLRRK